MTHKQIIKNYLQVLWLENPTDGWIEGFKLQSKELNGHWSSHKADARCREMAVKGEIERSYRDGYAIYRYKPSEDELDLIKEREQSLLNRSARSLF